MMTRFISVRSPDSGVRESGNVTLDDSVEALLSNRMNNTLKNEIKIPLLLAVTIVGGLVVSRTNTKSAAQAQPQGTAIWLDQLDLSVASQGWGSAMKNKSVD